MERAGEKVIHFELGRPDFDTPEYIKAAACKALAEGKVHYTSNYGTMELRQAIADKLSRENHVDYKASEVLVTVGLSEAVFAVLAAILNEGDEILVPDPVWLNYVNVPKDVYKRQLPVDGVGGGKRVWKNDAAVRGYTVQRNEDKTLLKRQHLFNWNG